MGYPRYQLGGCPYQKLREYVVVSYDDAPDIDPCKTRNGGCDPSEKCHHEPGMPIGTRCYFYKTQWRYPGATEIQGSSVEVGASSTGEGSGSFYMILALICA